MSQEYDRLSLFWSELNKVCSTFEEDNFTIGVYVIDPKHQTAEINGNLFLKRLLFAESSKINAQWATHAKEKNDKSTNETNTRVQTPGTRCFLPPLPVGGISAMTDKVLKAYWRSLIWISGQLTIIFYIHWIFVDKGDDNVTYVCSISR